MHIRIIKLKKNLYGIAEGKNNQTKKI
jgi:hypothetical protein